MQYNNPGRIIKENLNGTNIPTEFSNNVDSTISSLSALFSVTPSAWATLITSGLSAIITIYDDLNVSLKETKEKLHDASAEFSNQQYVLKSLSEELKVNESYINIFNSKPSLTYIEEDELERLKNFTAELEHQLAIKKLTANFEAAQLYEQNKSAFDKEYGSDSFDIKKVKEIKNGPVLSNAELLSFDDSDIEGLAGGLLQLRATNEAALNEAAANYEKALQTGNQTTINEAKQLFDIASLDYEDNKSFEKVLESRLISNLSTLQEYKDNLMKTMDYRELTEKEKDFYELIESGQKIIFSVIQPSEWNHMEFSKMFSTEGL